MAKVKYRLNNFVMFEYRNVEEYLAKMAAKGWRLEKCGGWFWKYRRAEPKAVSYAVTYVPQASYYDPGPTPEQVALEEFCDEAGWEKVGDWAQAQIYCNERPDPVPLETEESVRLDIIKKSMKKSFLPANLFSVVLFVLMFVLGVIGFRKQPVAVLSQWSMLLVFVMSLFGILISIVTVGGYFLWVKRSEKQIANGGTCAETNITGLNRLIWIPLIGVILLFAWQSAADFRYWAAYLGLYSVIIFVLQAMIRHMKRVGVSRQGNIAVTLIFCFVAGFALNCAIGYAADRGWFDKEDQTEESVLYEGYAWELSQDYMPLRVEDLLETDYEYYDYNSSRDSTLLLSVTKGAQRRGVPDGTSQPSIGYEAVEVKLSFLYDWALQQYLENNYIGIEYNYEPADHAPWSADRAWSGVSAGGDRVWLLSDGVSRVVRFWASWDLSGEQMALVGETLLRGDLSAYW